MKKIFTLFIATVVAVSMMAVPQVKKVGKKVNPASKEQFEAKTPVQTKVMELAKDARVLRSFERAQDMKKLPATHAPLKVAAAQAADTVELHFDAFAVVPEYYEEDGDWYMSFSANGWIVKFDIVSSSYVGTFTEEDLLWNLKHHIYYIVLAIGAVTLQKRHPTLLVVVHHHSLTIHNLSIFTSCKIGNIEHHLIQTCPFAFFCFPASNTAVDIILRVSTSQINPAEDSSP